jgi:hypothetical protein
VNTLALTPPTALDNLKIALNPEGAAAKEQALAKAEFILAVSNPAEQQQAIAACADLKRFAKDVEKSRETLKRPFWDAGVAIDTAAKNFIESVTPEVRRLETLVADYQKAEQAKADAVRREQERIQRELEQKRIAEEREKLRLEQEAWRKEQEAQRLATEAKTKAAREAAAAEAKRLEDERLEREFADPAPAPAPIVLPPAPVAPKADGAAVKTEYVAEVVDLDALYAWAGQRFVKLEVRAADLKYYVNSPGCQRDKIPGVTVREETRVAVRATR